MDDLVVDASITMTWCHPDENSDYAYRILDTLDDAHVLVPSLWAVEIANALVVGERRKRLTTADTARFFELLRGLPIATDTLTASRALSDTLQLARTHRLSAYDATYLELAMRERATLATLDERLKNAAHAVGVKVFP